MAAITVRPNDAPAYEVTEYLLYGLAAGSTERYEEVLLTETTDRQRIDQIKILAAKDGFHSFRVATWNGEAPDFAGTVRV
jgi:hypothetical protein